MNMKISDTAMNKITIVNNQRNRSSVSNMLQRLKWRPLANRRKDARLMMMYKIDRELVYITKENRLIPPCRRSRNTHNSQQGISTFTIKSQLQMYIHVGTAWAWRLKGHNPGLKGFRYVQLHNV
jgi:hypothetical protein